MRISICIPTFRRTEGFLRAARSVFAQVGLTEFDVELVAIDNSPEGSAVTTLQRVQAQSPIPMHITHERRAGVAHARNAALRLATGDLIAWLDDDQEASPLWLDRLVAARTALKADVVFGPITGEAPHVPHSAYFERLYSRTGPKENTLLAGPLGIGNSLMRRAMLPDVLAPFDPSANETGGEDDLLFADAAARGAAFGWAAGAWVREHVPAARATLADALKRAFVRGQAISKAARGAPLALAGRMAEGAAQAVFFGASAGVASALQADGCAALFDRAARGAGQALWFRRQKIFSAA